MMGGMVGLLLAIAVILVMYYSDMSIRSEDDVRKYLGLGTLAAVPYEKSISEGHESKSSKKKKAKKRR